MRLGVLASGAGTNLQALIDGVHVPPGTGEGGEPRGDAAGGGGAEARAAAGGGGAEARAAAGGGAEARAATDVCIVAVASDQPGAPALARAEAAGIATAVFPRTGFPDRTARDAAITAWLEDREVELVVLAGYMALLEAPFVRRWAGRLLNVHPSLLPAFPGIRAIEQALDYGVALFGVTVHLVDEGVDTGPVLLQEAIALPAARTPEEVHDALRPLEHRLLCATVRAFAAGTVRPDPGHPRRWLVG